MEKCKNDLLQMLQSILGETGAAAEYALLKALKEDLENKKNPEYLKHAEKATEYDFNEDAEKLPDEKTEIPTTKTLEDRLDVEMERELTDDDYALASTFLGRAEHCYLIGESGLSFSNAIEHSLNRKTLERLEKIFALVSEWLEKKLSEYPTLDENLEEACVDYTEHYDPTWRFWQDYKALPMNMTNWLLYIDEDLAFQVWLKYCQPIKDDDERISEFTDALKDEVLDILFEDIKRDKKLIVQNPEIMSELVDRLWTSNLSFVRTNEKIKLI